MLLLLLGALDVITALIAMYSINFGGLTILSNTLLVIILIKGLWSLFSYFGVIGSLDVITPVMALISINFSILPVISYLLLSVLIFKGLWSIFAGLH